MAEIVLQTCLHKCIFVKFFSNRIDFPYLYIPTELLLLPLFKGNIPLRDPHVFIPNYHNASLLEVFRIETSSLPPEPSLYIISLKNRRLLTNESTGKLYGRIGKITCNNERRRSRFCLKKWCVSSNFTFKFAGSFSPYM